MKCNINCTWQVVKVATSNQLNNINSVWQLSESLLVPACHLAPQNEM